MAEIKITIQKCDLCGAKSKKTTKPDGWEYFDYAETWKSGSHSGWHEKKFMACYDCIKGRGVFKKIFKALTAR